MRDLAAQKHDHLAITGDLVNIALAAEFRSARAWLEQLGAPDHVTLVPGNHDLYVRETAAQAQREWGAYMRGDEFESFPFVRRRGNVALIGRSSALPPAPFLGTGQLGEKQLAQLEELLATLGGEGLFRVVLIHHPPVSEPARYLKRPPIGVAAHGAAKARRGTAHPWPRPHAQPRVDRWPGCAHAGAGRTVGLGVAGRIGRACGLFTL